MFGISNNFNYDPTALKFMQLYTIVGAGGFGLLHLIAPNIFVQLLNAPSNTTMLGDMFVASVFLAFSVLAITNIKTSESYAPIAGFQGIYKTLWCVFFIVNASLGNIDVTFFSSIYFLIMLSFAIGDYLVFKPRADEINVSDT
tara:strand:+ start:100 stop:528 length:429 start_codon:yes stop_codon:yes gene_type:complete